MFQETLLETQTSFFPIMFVIPVIATRGAINCPGNVGGAVENTEEACRSRTGPESASWRFSVVFMSCAWPWKERYAC